jgi:hypothetical protein
MKRQETTSINISVYLQDRDCLIIHARTRQAVAHVDEERIVILATCVTRHIHLPVLPQRRVQLPARRSRESGMSDPARAHTHSRLAWTHGFPMGLRLYLSSPQLQEDRTSGWKKTEQMRPFFFSFISFVRTNIMLPHQPGTVGSGVHNSPPLVRAKQLFTAKPTSIRNTALTIPGVTWGRNRMKMRRKGEGKDTMRSKRKRRKEQTGRKKTSTHAVVFGAVLRLQASALQDAATKTCASRRASYLPMQTNAATAAAVTPSVAWIVRCVNKNLPVSFFADGSSVEVVFLNHPFHQVEDLGPLLRGFT